VQIPYTWGYVDSINRIRRDTGKVVEVVSTWGNQKAISGGMGRVFRTFNYMIVIALDEARQNEGE
jgi:hypothetical protein